MTSAAEESDAAGDPRPTRFTVGPSEDGWYVSRRFARWADSLHERKSEAIARATELARQNTPSRLRILRADGTTQEERGYS